MYYLVSERPMQSLIGVLMMASGPAVRVLQREPEPAQMLQRRTLIAAATGLFLAAVVPARPASSSAGYTLARPMPSIAATCEMRLQCRLHGAVSWRLRSTHFSAG
jgi:hypothetical protein